MSDVKATIAQRQNVHGDWESNARVSTSIMRALSLGDKFNALDDVSMASLTQIANKMCRIVSGDAAFGDHWHDIAGYATLAETYHLKAANK